MAKPIEKSVAEEHPTSEEIVMRAYEIYIARGATPGQDVDDWLQAEAELSGEQKQSARMGKSARA